MSGNEKQLQDILDSLNKLIVATSLSQQQTATLQEQLDILSKKVSKLEEQNQKLETQNKITNRMLSELYNTQSVKEVVDKMSKIGKEVVDADEFKVYVAQDEEFKEVLKKTAEKTSFYAEGKNHVISVPLETKNGDIIGVVVAKRENEPFTTYDAEIFDLNNGELGTIFRVNLEQKLAEQAAITDKLTKLQNREGLSKFVKNKVRCRVQDQLPVSVIMFDIDYFKQFNDRYGHDIGDRCLKLVADTIKKTVNIENSGVFRWGGEEMIVILPVNEEKAFEIAENVRHALGKTELVVNDKTNETTQVTVSGGVCEFKPKSIEVDLKRIEKSFEKCIKEADNRLYEAKESGRNRVYASNSFMQEHYSLPSPNVIFQSWYENHSKHFALLNEKDTWTLVETYGDSKNPYQLTTPKNTSDFIEAVIGTKAFHDNVIEIMKNIISRDRFYELANSALSLSKESELNERLAEIMLTEWENISKELPQEIYNMYFADVEAIKVMVYTPELIDRECIKEPRQEQIKSDLKRMSKNNKPFDKDV